MRKIKTYKGDYYGINSIFGNDWARYYILTGGREAGKSYTVMDWAVKRKLKKKDNFKFYWFRLTDESAKNLLSGGAEDFIDPDIARKHGVKTFTRNKRIYTYKPKTRKKRDGQEVAEKDDVREFCTVLSCSTFYNTKGVGYFDNEFKGEYFIVLDEMNREQSEKNGFDIVYSFVNLLENVSRSTSSNIRVVMIGNTLEESSDLLAAFNFLPDGFGRFKLKKKHLVVDNIMPNEKYIARRKESHASIILPEASTFTNEVEIDRSLLVNKRCRYRPQHIVKFSKSKDTWFTVWNGGIVSQYNDEKVPAIAMRRYLDEQFSIELQKRVFEMYDARAYKFTSLSAFKRFQKQLKLLKKQ